jgi:hypothetical protein
LQQINGMCSRPSVATQFYGHHDILQCGERRDKLKCLKHKPNMRVPEAGKGIFTQEIQGVTVQAYRARGWPIQAGA